MALLEAIYEAGCVDQRCHLFHTAAQGCLQGDSLVPAMICFGQAGRRGAQRERGAARTCRQERPARPLEESCLARVPSAQGSAKGGHGMLEFQGDPTSRRDLAWNIV